MDDTGVPFSKNGKSGGSAKPRLRWDDARVFLAIARTGSLSGAAILLDIGLGTTSRRVDRLEAALGVPLFSRHQSSYRLTDDGEALIGSAEALEHAAHAFGREAADQGQVAGCVRLATAENLAHPIIIPSLGRLLDKHPGLGVEVVTDIRTVNLRRRDADLAIRMVRPDRGNITIRRLGVLGFGLYGAPDYINKRPAGRDAESFENDGLIGWSDMQRQLPASQWIEQTRRGRP